MSFGLTFRGRKGASRSAWVWGAVLLLAACSKDKELEYKEQSVYEIYSQALGYLDNGDFKDAAQYFAEVERQHPYSVWATKAKIMAAYALYESNKYDDAVSAVERFIAVHPGNRDVVYAYYLKALCYYEQIADVQRDQELTQKALDSSAGCGDALSRDDLRARCPPEDRPHPRPSGRTADDDRTVLRAQGAVPRQPSIAIRPWSINTAIPAIRRKPWNA